MPSPSSALPLPLMNSTSGTASPTAQLLEQGLPPSPPLSASFSSASACSPSSSPCSTQDLYLAAIKTLRQCYDSLQRDPNDEGFEAYVDLARDDFERLRQEYLHPILDVDHENDNFRVWCAHKLRWSYDDSRRRLSVRIPTKVYEIVASFLTTTIYEGIRLCAQRWTEEVEKDSNTEDGRRLENVVQALSSVKSTGSADVRLMTEEGLKRAQAQARAGSAVVGDGQSSVPGVDDIDASKEDNSEREESATAQQQQGNEQHRRSHSPLHSEISSDRDTGRAYNGETILQPDVSFTSQFDAVYPALVCNVAYTQRPNDLPRLAEDYIVGSLCHIRCVIGIQARSKRSSTRSKRDKTAKVSIWRSAIDEEQAGYCRCDMDSLPFRDVAGQAVDDTNALSINVADVLHATTVEQLHLTQEERQTSIARITFADLRNLLDDAERQQRQTRRARRQQTWSKPVFGDKAMTGVKWKRKRTPEEELSEGRQAKFLAAETAEQERVDRTGGTVPIRRERPLRRGNSETGNDGEVIVTRRLRSPSRIPPGV